MRDASRPTCSACCFWSELVACSSPEGIRAVCLSSAGPRSGQWPLARDTCSAYQAGLAIDTPGYEPDAITPTVGPSELDLAPEPAP